LCGPALTYEAVFVFVCLYGGRGGPHTYAFMHALGLPGPYLFVSEFDEECYLEIHQFIKHFA
jgi:hypothetical protein